MFTLGVCAVEIGVSKKSPIFERCLHKTPLWQRGVGGIFVRAEQIPLDPPFSKGEGAQELAYFSACFKESFSTAQTSTHIGIV
jgi:hypothetical protein